MHARPVFIVPPQINKFYVYDMSPDKSLVKFADAGFQVFMVSWRNPTAEHRHWGLADYVEALEDAIDAVREITGSPDVSCGRRVCGWHHADYAARLHGGARRATRSHR